MNFTHQWLSKERYSGKHLRHEGRIRGAHSSRSLLPLHRVGSEAIAGLSRLNLFFSFFSPLCTGISEAAASRRMERRPSAVIQNATCPPVQPAQPVTICPQDKTGTLPRC